MKKNVTSIQKTCAPCHLSIKDIVHHELVLVLEGLPCLVCGEKKTNGYYVLV